MTKTDQQYAEKAAKVDLTLISAHAAEAEARVLMFGDSKYSRRDYLNQPDYDLEAMRALLRHVGEVMKGNQYDQETGQHHLAHIRANAGIILECWAVHDVEPSVNWPHVAAKPKVGKVPAGLVTGTMAPGAENNPKPGKLITKGAVVGPNSYSLESAESDLHGADRSPVNRSGYKPPLPPIVPQGRGCS